MDPDADDGDINERLDNGDGLPGTDSPLWVGDPVTAAAAAAAAAATAAAAFCGDVAVPTPNGEESESGDAVGAERAAPGPTGCCTAKRVAGVGILMDGVGAAFNVDCGWADKVL